MSRPTLIWVFAFVAAAFLLYMVKYQVQYLRQQVAQTVHELELEREGLHVVAAEWAYLNRPERLQELARKYLASSEMTVNQVADIQMIPFPSYSEAAVTSEDTGVEPVAARYSSDSGEIR